MSPNGVRKIRSPLPQSKTSYALSGESSINNKKYRLKRINVKLPFPGIQIDYMQESDLPTVMEIERSSFSAPWAEASFREGLKHRNRCFYFLVTRHHQNPIAFISFWVVADEAHIANFAVAPDHRNQGVGKYLFGECLTHIQKLGGDQVSLEVRVSNMPAQHLYRQFGFRIVAIRKDYYIDDREDAYVFQLSNLGNIDLCINPDHTDRE